MGDCTDDGSPKHWNFLGHTPCPKCKKPYRYMVVGKLNVVQCDDCSHEEPATRENSNEYSGATFNDEVDNG